MHRDKTVARILLILSVVHVAAAAPAIARHRSLDVDEDVTAASEKRGNFGNTPRGLYLVPQMDNDRPSRTAQLDNGPPPASGTLQLDDDRPSKSGALQLDNDRPPASGAPHDPPPASGTPQLDDDPQLASGASHLHNNPPLALGTPQLHGDPPTASKTSSVHDAPPFGPDAFDESYRFKNVHCAPSPLHESDTPPTYDHRFSYAPWPQTRPTNSFIRDQDYNI